ncbi:sigma-54-dependent transcriptional regulator [Litorilituus lipolyticus]|uniref:Sigma-54-dependent Fis family transcriptional regulator n=1 Tax=Litorilituus lipolyticus TaxID=2491017 RepID=A0A502KRC2_9GAMM|nr:sigma-54 dependent transcriptional regulator [Litorilituus lipolyticus]TPH12143.1 sigma-54-dependent Fis family transcriptional regulator [Litorilituus lipolyticus]
MLNATILIADDDEDIRLALNLLLSAHGYKIIEASNAKEITIKAQSQQPDLVLLDMNFSLDTTSGQEGLAILAQLKPLAIPVILMTAWGSIELAVEGLQNGANDFIEKPWNKIKLLNSIEQQLKLSKVTQQNQGFKQLLSNETNKHWVSQSQSMQQIEQLVEQIAPTDANVLILGENGTGKSQLAERIHQLSLRQHEPLITVNMAAIPENLFESELFGHQKGAFTDAKQHRTGRFTLADKGTLFFDEIGSLPISLQPKLLRVLETGQFEVLGSSQTQTTNVRLISATNADLDKLIDEDKFRQDLLYRLNTLVITLPALKDRIEDIQPLSEHFIALFCQKYKKAPLAFTDNALKKLKQHSWPGNVRELSHVIERAVLLAMTDSIDDKQLMIEQTTNKAAGDITLQPLEAAEQQLIEKALKVSSGQVSEAAKLLDISRNALYRRLEKFGIQYEA